MIFLGGPPPKRKNQKGAGSRISTASTVGGGHLTFILQIGLLIVIIVGLKKFLIVKLTPFHGTQLHKYKLLS